MDFLHPEEAARSFLSRLCKPSHILVACSGGGDSLGLLFALHHLQSSDVSISVTTVDHALREGSRAEAETVGAFCAARGLRHKILTWNGDKPKTGLQAAARQARYHLLGEHALDIGADVIVTAHNFEDQLETLAMRKARNPDAESGISPLVLIDGKIWLYRPFLAVKRDLIRDYLRAAQISWAEDPSNNNMRFERVRVRNSLMETGSVPDFDLASQRRLKMSEDAALFIGDHVRFIGSCCAFSAPAFDIDNKAHFFALLHLIALRGGGTHLLGRDERKRLIAFLREGDRLRYTVGGVVMEKRQAQIFIVRENRNIISLALAAKSNSLWDGRFLITNNGTVPAYICAGRIVPHLSTLAESDGVSSLPSRIRRLVNDTDPVLVEGEKPMLDIKPVIACFGQFLPCERFPIGQVLANGLGLAHFPSLPFG